MEEFKLDKELIILALETLREQTWSAVVECPLNETAMWTERYTRIIVTIEHVKNKL